MEIREGYVYGLLTVIRKMDDSARPQGVKPGGEYFLCRCSCGKHTVVLGASLKSGNTQSCGCRLIEGIKKRAQERVAKVGKGRADRLYAWGVSEIQIDGMGV